MRATGWMAVSLALCANGCMSETTRMEAAGPPTIVASRTGPQLPAPPRARVTLTANADSLDAKVEAIRACSSELLQRTPREKVTDTTPRVGGLITVGALTGLGVFAATRDDDSSVTTASAALFLVPAALAAGLMVAASGEERSPAPPLNEPVPGPVVVCDVQPWPGVRLSLRTSAGAAEGNTNQAGMLRLKITERPLAVFVDGDLVDDVVWASRFMED